MDIPSLVIEGSTFVFSEETGTIVDISGGNAMIGESRTVWINDEVTGKDRNIGQVGKRVGHAAGEGGGVSYGYNDVPLRTGQRITIISEGSTDMLLVNHDAGEVVTLNDGGDLLDLDYGFLRRRRNLVRWGWAIAVLLLLGGCSIALGNNLAGVVAVVLSAGAVYAFRKNKREIPDAGTINQHLRELGHSVLQQGELPES